MATRSFNITLVNQTGWPLALTPNCGFNDGEWSNGGQAPSNVAAGATVQFQSEDDGFLTGTDGYLTYQVLDNNPLQPDPNGGTDEIPVTSWVYMHWDNPYSGTTQMNCHMSTVPLNSGGGPATSQDGSGTFNVATPVTLYEVGFTGINRDDGDDPSLNGGTAAGTSIGVPLFPLFSIFANTGIEPHASVTLYLQLKATDLSAWAIRQGRDLSKGVRALNPPNGSLRALLSLPRAPAKS
jgi:hypothetical protein